jgi:hypothetical protein
MTSSLPHHDFVIVFEFFDSLIDSLVKRYNDA